jgi:hypothetical protein
MRECLDEGTLQSYFDGELAGERMEGVTSHLASCTTCAAAASELETELNLLSVAMAAEFDVAVPTERLRQRIDAAVAGLQYESSTAGGKRDSSISAWFRSLSSLFALTPQRAFGYAGLVVVLGFAAIFGIMQWRYVSPAIDNQNFVASVPVTKTMPGVEDPTPTMTPAVAVVPSTVNPKVFRPRNVSGRSQSTSANRSVAKVKLLPGERSYLRTIAALDTSIKANSNRPMRPALRAEYERNLALVDRALAATRDAAKKNPNDPDAAEFMFTAYQSKVNLLNTVADARSFNRPD